jgi:effector-binding domain-containing protein
MAYEVIEKEAPDVLVATVTEHAPLVEASRVIPAAFGALMEAVMPTGLGRGMPGVVYHEMDPERPGDIEAFVPVVPAFVPPPGVVVRTIAGGRVISTVHRGPYEELGHAYDALAGWMVEHEEEPAGPPRELYLNDPTEVGFEEALTEIDWPIAGGAGSR